MRYLVSFVAAALFLAAPSICQDNRDAPKLQLNFSIVYSGRMFGYLRDPDVQQVSDVDCSPKEAADQGASPSAKEYLNHAGVKRGPRELRVAMGDNFSPELLSRNMYDPNPPAGQSNFLLRSLYSPAKAGGWVRDVQAHGDGRFYPPLHGMMPSDNVACFIKEAQFQAVVPGKEDFYFGPERLNETARFLAKYIDSKFRRVEMLGANLIVTTTKRGAAKPLPAEELPKDVRDAVTPPTLRGALPDQHLSIELPGTVLPWLHRVAIKGLPKKVNPSAIRGSVCPADEKDPNVFLRNCPPGSLLREENGTYYFEFPDALAGQQPHFVLAPDSNQAVCLDIDKSALDEGKSRKYCKTFRVVQPFFQVSEPGTLAIDSQSPMPYYAPGSKSGLAGIAVFGVVDTDLQHQVGLLNSAWLNRNPEFDTSVQIIDPVDSLTQLMQQCDDDPACRSAGKVLLAQMPLFRAKSLISKLKSKNVFFEAVITQVEDENATGNVSETRQDDKSGPLDPFYIVPRTQWDPESDKNVKVRYQKADLFLPALSGTNFRSQLENRVDEYVVKPATQVDGQVFANFTDRVRKFYLKQRPSPTRPDAKTAFEYLALNALLEGCNSDVALAQPRDIFINFEAPVNLWPKMKFGLITDQNLTDEVFWKGDFAICKTFTGASLKGALKKSAASDGYQTLTSLGVKKDDLHDNFVIHGEALDEKKIYSVALTDYLAFGDTGYSELAGGDLKPLDTVGTFKSFKPVAALAANAVFGFPIEAIKASSYFDRIDSVPTAETPGFNRHRQVLDWFDHWIAAYPYTPSIFAKKPSPKEQLEDDAQRRHLWFFNIEKLNIGYNLTFIGGRQQDVPDKFADIYNVPKLQTLEASSWSSWGRLRGGYQFPEFLDIFGAFETRYGNSKVRLSADPVTGYNPYSTSVTDNAVEVESGIVTKRISSKIPLRILLSERISTQLFKPLLSYTSGFGGPTVAANTASNCSPNSIDVALTASAPQLSATSTASVSCAVARSVLRVTKFGARIENRDSWVESGWESGANSNSPYLYTFNKGNATEVNCPLAGSENLSTCVANQPNVNQHSPLYVSSRSLPVSGWFLNFRASVPLKQNDIRLVAESYGEIFSKNSQDTNADTRLYDDIVISLPVRIFQNLSLAPQVEFFYFKNQVNFDHFFSSSSSITLDYSFDYHRGITFRKAVRNPDAGTVTKNTTFAVP